MNNKNNLSEIQSKIKDVTKRRQELETEAQALKATIAERASELPRVYFERGDVSKLLEAQSSDTKRLTVLRDALAVADQALAELGGILYAEKLLDLANSQKEFDGIFIHFLDGPLQFVFEEFNKVSKAYDEMMNKQGAAGESAMYGRDNFPYLQKTFYDFLQFYFNKNAMPADVANLTKTYKDHFAKARKAAK